MRRYKSNREPSSPKRSRKTDAANAFGSPQGLELKDMSDETKLKIGKSNNDSNQNEEACDQGDNSAVV